MYYTCSEIWLLHERPMSYEANGETNGEANGETNGEANVRLIVKL